MPRLSIIIPLVGQTSQFEQTLVSVLEHRPDDCEILVVHGGEYDDPYGLGEEVTFITTGPAADFTERLAVGVDIAQGEIVSTLRCGVTVDSDWTSPAMVCFDSAEVGAVASVLLNVEDETRLAGCGVYLSGGGRRRISAGGKRTPLSKLSRLDGPLFSAGFYRRRLLQIALPTAVKLGDPGADLDVAMCLKKAGWTCATAVDSVVLGSPEEAPPLGFCTGRSNERLFRRHALPHSTVWRMFHLAGEMFSGLLHPWRLVCQWWGRFIGFCTPDTQAVEHAVASLRQATAPPMHAGRQAVSQTERHQPAAANAADSTNPALRKTA